MITIIDYGLGNLGSVKNMLKRIKVPAQITADLEEIRKAEKIILPGVGSFDAAMLKLREQGMIDVLNDKALKEKVPVMGICLGMQLLVNSSEEGKESGLGWIPGKVTKFAFEDRSLKIPHMGWNYTNVSKNANPILEDFDHFKFYFVHSYFVQVEREENRLLTTEYGHEFDAGIAKDNIFGFQFHPEKSHKFGMKLFENFAQL
jgi:glutamine amidotransferase